jgi:hypothetical protein
MPANSKAQQKLMGMVHADQEGKLDNPSPEVKHLAATMKKGDVTDFASTSQAGLPDKKSIEEILEAIAGYQKLGEALQRATTMQEVGGQLAQIAEYAEQAVVNEADNWFDKHTVGRNMKEIKGYSKDFLKLAEEADGLNQRMTALYDDMGRILERYFEIPDVYNPAGPNAQLDEPEPVMQEPGGSGPTPEEPQALKESPGVAGVAVPPDPKVYRASPLPAPTSKKTEEEKVAPGIHDNKDVLTARAIKLVHARLKKTNPEMAKKFAKLPVKKMQRVVWRLVK